jgi:hypothetical protein
MRRITTFIISFCIPTLSIAFVKWSFYFKEIDRILILAIGFVIWFAIESYYYLVIKGN